MRLQWPSLFRPGARVGRPAEAGFTARLVSLFSKRQPSDYEVWMARHDTFGEREQAELRRRLSLLDRQPLLSIVMPVYNTDERFLREAIASVRSQIYEHWELCIADDGSDDVRVRKVLEEYAALDRRIRVVFQGERGHVSRASNAALSLAGGDWIALLDHDDLLSPRALAEVALEIEKHPEAELIYSDEDKIDEHGRRYEPYFKPEFSRELFRSQNYFNHLTVHRARNIGDVGGWRVGFEGSQDYDLNLRIFENIDPKNIRHIPKILYHWRAAKGSTARAVSNKNYAYAAGLRALQDHVERTGLAARVEEAQDVPYYRLRHQLPENQPRVTLIIPTRDNVRLLRACVDSIRKKTTYRNYEILIVDNQSAEPAALAYLEDLKSTPDVRVLAYDKPFNYSAINNFAAGYANGTILALINNDLEVISADWLTEMVSWAVQPDIGCVGAKLYFADSAIQHGGVILGVGGVAGHAHKYFPRDSHGYFGRLKLVQNLSAVTGACLVVRKEIYERLGGLNEEALVVAFNDVDFCLRVREAGYLNVWTPYAELYHFESRSRGPEDTPEKVKRFGDEIRFMQERWGEDLRNDPFYSIHLTLEHENYGIRV